MANSTRGGSNGDPQLSWMTVISMIGLVALLFGGSWAVFQTQFANVEELIKTDRAQSVSNFNELKNELIVLRGAITGEKRFEELLKRVDTQEQRILDIIAKSARNPVEGGEVTALVSAIDKRLDVVQAQIADINRQIAAAILLGDGDKKKSLVPP